MKQQQQMMSVGVQVCLVCCWCMCIANVYVCMSLWWALKRRTLMYILYIDVGFHFEYKRNFAKKKFKLKVTKA